MDGLVSIDHAITPDVVQREMVRLTDTADRTSKVAVQPGVDEQGVDIVVIAFSCDDHQVAIACLPVHLLLSVDNFAERVLTPLASHWSSTRPDDVEEIAA